MIKINELKIEYANVEELRPAEYNPRKWTDKARKGLNESLDEFGFVQPIVVNSAPERKGIVIGGNFKLDIAKKDGLKQVPVVYVNIPDIEKEKELNIRLNKNQGDFDFEMLSDFDEKMLLEIGFDDDDMKDIFNIQNVNVSKSIISFSVSDKQSSIIRSALLLAQNKIDEIEYDGKRPKMSDYLCAIIKQWQDRLN